MNVLIPLAITTNYATNFLIDSVSIKSMDALSLKNILLSLSILI